MNNSDKNVQCAESVSEDEYKKQIEELKKQLQDSDVRIKSIEDMNTNLAKRINILNESVPFYTLNKREEKSDYSISEYIHNMGMLSFSTGLVVASYHPKCPIPNTTHLLGLLSMLYYFPKHNITFSKMSPLLYASYLVYCGWCIRKSKS
jgi:hypothetical protein